MTGPRSALTLAHLVVATSPENTIDAAARAGFTAVGLRICARRPGDPFAGTPVLGIPDAARALRERARDAGIRLSNVSGYQFYPDVDWPYLAPVVDAAAELGVRTIVVNGFDPDLGRFKERFRRYCDAASAADIAIALEFLPYSCVKNLRTAIRVLDDVGADNAGLLLDALHLDRSGASPRDIVGMPESRIALAQLCDAKTLDGPRSDEQLLNEARTARLPAGEGDLPLFEFLDALPKGTEIEYEVARSDMSARTPLEKAQVARADSDRFMADYQRHSEGARR